MKLSVADRIRLLTLWMERPMAPEQERVSQAKYHKSYAALEPPERTVVEEALSEFVAYPGFRGTLDELRGARKVQQEVAFLPEEEMALGLKQQESGVVTWTSEQSIELELTPHMVRAIERRMEQLSSLELVGFALFDLYERMQGGQNGAKPYKDEQKPD